MSEVEFLNPRSIQDLFRKKLYSTKGVFLGVVIDVEFERETGNITGLLIRLQREVDGQKKMLIPYNLVSAIGDIILVEEMGDGIGGDAL